MATSDTPPAGGAGSSSSRTRYQYLTDTNPGTPAGELLRRYWQPIALVADQQLRVAPRAIRIMGQDLVLLPGVFDEMAR